jgi:predicted dehydrogenase
MIEQIAGSAISQHFELTALCDQSESLLHSVAAPDDITRYNDLDALLKDDSVEAIGLFTGPIGRANLIRKIIRAGRDVITTKPLEMDASAMLEVLEEAAQLGRVVHCNSPGPLVSQDLKIIRKWVLDYDLGYPVGAIADVWVSYREKADGTWYDDPVRCPAPPIFRLGIYLLNDLVRLWGKVEQVQLTESRVFTGRPTADNAQLHLLFENSAIATIYASFCVGDGDQYRNGLTLNFERGTIYRNAGPAWSADRQGQCQLALVQRQKDGPSVVARETVQSPSGTYQWDYFARAIRGKVDPDELRPDQLVESIRVMQLAAALSSRLS